MERPALLVAGGHDDQRQDEPVPRHHLLPAAGKPGKVGPRAGRGGRHGELAALERLFGQRDAAAGEHRVARLRRGGEAGDPHVPALRAQRRDGDQRRAQRQVELVAGEGAGGGEHLAGRRRFGRRDGEGRAIAAEGIGKGLWSSAFAIAAMIEAPAMFTIL